MITINFASRNYRAVASAVRVLLEAAVVLAVVAVGIIWESSLLRRDLSEMKQKLAVAETGDKQAKFTLLEQEQLVKNLNAMSGLVEARKFSWTLFFTSLEAAVPTGVAFKNVTLSPKDRTLSIEGMAQSPEALRNLMVGLEKSNSFSKPLLRHQSLEKGVLSFNVVAIYHERKNAVVVQVGR
jgi:Tfp pilus assembly protein PilN